MASVLSSLVVVRFDYALIRFLMCFQSILSFYTCSVFAILHVVHHSYSGIMMTHKDMHLCIFAMAQIKYAFLVQTYP